MWSKPVTHLAKEFGLSDVAIHKICRKHEVPTPPLGWWAKKAAGKPVAQAPLLPATKGISDRITIAAPELRGETAAVAAVREEARIRASDDLPDENVGPDPIVERTLEVLRRATPAPNGLATSSGPDVIHCEVAPASIERLGMILGKIVAAASRQGFILQEGARRAQFAGDGEVIGVSVTETFRRVKHELTPAEQAEEAAWRKKRDRRRRGNPWDWEFEPRPMFPEWDYICTGQLGFEMEGVYIASGGGPRKTFRDAKIQRLENLTSDIAVALAVLATVKREARERREEEERKRQEERLERERPLRLKHIAERRREALDAVLNDLANIERLKRLMDGLAVLAGAERSPRVSEFLEWSQKELAAREAAFSREGLEYRFANDRIFGDDDDHSFKSPFWY
ncbi:hypothetical protein [Sphingomonas sp.]|uniref:hypothetical protein n=1 Tax=Sphingomonas sp. TaxID=28214 RepID=UPI0031CE3992